MAASRANTLATNQQATQQNVNNTAYSQGVNSAQATSQGAQTVGNAQITGQNNYRSGVQAQQNQAQQGVGMATGTQQNAYGTQTNGLNASTATAANMKTGQPSALGDLTGVLNSVTGLAKAVGSSGAGSGGGGALGDVITKPEVRWIAERGPELVQQLRPRYRQNQQEAA